MNNITIDILDDDNHKILLDGVELRVFKNGNVYRNFRGCYWKQQN